MRKRIFTCVLALIMALTVIPSYAFAEETGQAAIQLVTGGTAANITGGQASNIYFGTYQQSSNGDGGYNTEPIKWRVLSNENGKLFLLSDKALDAGQFNATYHKDTSVTWSNCTLRSWLNGSSMDINNDGKSDINFFQAAFSVGEQSAIANTTYDGGITKIFLLSLGEAKNGSYFSDASSRTATATDYTKAQLASRYTGNSGGVGGSEGWWLCSIMVAQEGGVDVNKGYYVKRDGNEENSDLNRVVYVRPAFNLNLNSVLFTSAAEGGKPTSSVNDELTEIENYTGSDWKLTLVDKSRSFTVTEAGTTVRAKNGGTVTLHYSGATTGGNEYISVILEDASGNLIRYGRVLNPPEASGTVNIKIPEKGQLAEGTYTLHVFSEQYNGDEKTDYASAFNDVTLIVKNVEAKIGNVEYETLQEALNAAGEGTIIEIEEGTETGENDVTLPNGVTIKTKEGTVTPHDGNVKIVLDGDDRVKLIEGKLDVVEGEVKVKFGETIHGFDGGTGTGTEKITYTIDAENKTLTLGGNGSVTHTDITETDGTTTEGGGTTFTGKSGDVFTFDTATVTEGETTTPKTTVTIPGGAKVSGGGTDGDKATITGVTPTGEGHVTKVEIDPTSGEPTLIEGAGVVTGATVRTKFTVEKDDGSEEVKTVDVTVPSGTTATIDLDNLPANVKKLDAGGSVTITDKDGGKITYTAVDNESTFPLDGNKLTRTGEKAKVPAGTAKDVKLGNDDATEGSEYTAPVVSVPSTNSGKTTITKTGNGGTVTIENQGDTFVIGGKTYIAESANTVFTIDKDGNVGISKGFVTLSDGDSIIGGGKTITNPSDPAGDTITVTAGDGDSEDENKATVVVPSGRKVVIDGTEYEEALGTGAMTIVVTKDGGNKLTEGAVKLDSGETVDVGNSSTSVKNTGGEGTTITVKADPETGKSTVTAPSGGKVKIGGTEYDALATDTKFTVDDGGKTELTNGSATLNPGEGIVVKGVDTENTGSGDVTVDADGAVTVPTNGGVTIGKAKITGVTKRTTFSIGGDDDGNKKVSAILPAGGSVTVGGVTYTAASNGSGTLTIDPTTGKVIWASNVKAEIYDSSLIEYDMIPGVPVTVDGKYIYTAPLGGSLGDVKLTGRRDSEGKALNPAVNLKNNGGTVTVALANKPATSTVYTAANAGTRFAMSADDTDTTKIDLLDNGTSPNSALKFSDNEAHTVNGVVYQGQQVDGSVSKSAYTVTFGEASVDSGRRDEQGNVIMETVSRNIVSVESGSKVVVSMNVRATISVNSGRVKDNRFENVMPFTAAGKGASILIDNTDSGNPNVITARGYTYLEGITDSNGVITSYEIRRRYSEGGGVPTPTPTPAVVPVSIVLPKTGDMTIWQSILSFFGLL